MIMRKMIHNVLEDNDFCQSVISAIKNNQVNKKRNNLTKECKDVPGMIDINVVNETEKNLNWKTGIYVSMKIIIYLKGIL